MKAIAILSSRKDRKTCQRTGDQHCPHVRLATMRYAQAAGESENHDDASEHLQNPIDRVEHEFDFGFFDASQQSPHHDLRTVEAGYRKHDSAS
jgi:hypothetical protein